MDAKPQRLRAAPSALFDKENDSSQKLTVHQHHKSAGNIKDMAGPTSTLNAPPKRTAFGDLSNTNKQPFGENRSKDVSKSRVKSVVSTLNSRDTRVGEKENDVSKLAGKGTKYLSAAPISSGSSNLITKPVNRDAFLHIGKPGLAKKTTAVYRDTKVQPTNVLPQVNDLPAIVDKQFKNPRHYKSQPQLKTDQPVLRRTQSRYLNKSEKPIDFDALDDIDDNVTEAAYEDAVEQFSNDYEESPAEKELAIVTNGKFNHALDIEYGIEVGSQYAEVGSKYADTTRHSKTFPSAVSEPEEYWEEEDEQDLYDEQGYTTAHSYRSHGDNTTGGVTTLMAPKITCNTQKELEAARIYVLQNMTEDDQEEELWDVSMVAEYGEDIFRYYRELETQYLPNPHYMDIQTEIQWSMRSVLMDWLVQVHARFGLLPETLFLTVNYIDRFLSVKVVSLAKLQLVGATAILLASKYEEINCPSVQEIVYMVDKGFTCDEILKAERFMLSMLQFELGWPGPMSFLRRISKADDYDLETRTLAKYFLEVTIMDERFVGCPASYLAAGAHCLSRMMLAKGDWTLAHIHWSGYTMTQLRPLILMIMDCCQDPRKHHQAVYEKYSSSKYHRSSTFVENSVVKGWAIPFPTFAPQLPGSSSTLEDDSHTLEYNRMSLTAEC